MIKIESGQFLDFVKLFPIRRNKKEKKKIQENLLHYFGSFDMKALEYEEGLGLRKVRHFLFGDPDEAKTVFVCGYDTAERLLIGSGDYWPLEENRNRSKVFVNITLSLLIAVAMAIGGIFLLRYALSLKDYWRYINIVCAVIVFYLANHIIQGFTNRATFSKSASLFMMLELAKYLHDRDYAYLFLDYGSYSKVGISFLNKEMFQNKKKIYLDFFGDGDTLLIGHDDIGVHLAKTIEENYQENKTRINLSKTVNRFNDIENIVVLNNVYEDKDGSWVVRNVRTDDDLTVDANIMQETVDVLVRIYGGQNKK